MELFVECLVLHHIIPSDRRPCFIPKTCIICFQKENYVFNISELEKYCACITRMDLNLAIKVAVFENGLPLGQRRSYRNRGPAQRVERAE